MMKRPLVISAASLFCGVVSALCDISIWFFVLGAVLIGAALSFSGFKKAAIFLTVAFLFLMCGMLRADFAQKNQAKTASLYGHRREIMTLTAADFSDEGKVIATFKDKGKSVKIYLSIKSAQKLFPGDIIKAEISMQKPFAQKVGSGGFDTYLMGRNVSLYASCDAVRVVGEAKGFRGAIYSLRRKINDTGTLSLGGERRAFFNAMVLGDKSLLSEDMTASLQGAGLNHIAVVSGMHLSVLLALVMYLINKLMGKRRLGNVIAILCCVVITLATGAGASVIRACIMCCIYQVARMLYRENDTMSALAFSAGVMCLFNPYIIFNVGFVLSVLSVLGIILYGEKFTAFFRKFLPAKMAEAAALSVSAQLTVTVAVIYYFGIVTPYALISNVLLFPFASGFVMTGMAFSALSTVPLVGGILKFLLSLFSDVISFVCRGVSSLPGAILSVNGVGTPLLIVWIFVLLCLFLYPRRKEKLIFAGVATLFAIVICVCVQNAHKDDIKISFLNYGAQAMSGISLPDGGLFLIDCFDTYDAKALLKASGKDSFDTVILTSSKEKKVLPLVQEGLVKKLILPSEMYDEEKKGKLKETLSGCGARIAFIPRGGSLFEEGVFIEDISLDNVSNVARCIKIEYKGKRFITLAGFKSEDIETLCKEKVKFDADCVKIPFVTLGEKTDVSSLCDGDIIQREKEFNIK